MGGSGGGYFESANPEQVKDALRREEKATEDQVFETEVSKQIGVLLTDYNTRDINAIRSDIEKLRKALEKDVEEGTITPVFGGSVRKHTYVDGISDIDSLFILKGDEFKTVRPGEALDLLETKVRSALPHAKVDRDNMSLRIQHEGRTLEILPAVRKGNDLCISSEVGNSWSKINPQAFLTKLSDINEKNGSKVVPAIKIVKGINDTFPENYRLTGYHIESLAIEAFKNYTGHQNTKAMVEHLVDFASERVLGPIRDKTGQSLHVDEYAGAQGSAQRKVMAQNLDRVRRRMSNANATHSVTKWLEIIS